MRWSAPSEIDRPGSQEVSPPFATWTAERAPGEENMSSGTAKPTPATSPNAPEPAAPGKETAEQRAARLAELKRQIDAGRYHPPLEAIADKLLNGHADESESS